MHYIRKVWPGLQSLHWLWICQFVQGKLLFTSLSTFFFLSNAVCGVFLCLFVCVLVFWLNSGSFLIPLPSFLQNRQGSKVLLCVCVFPSFHWILVLSLGNIWYFRSFWSIWVSFYTDCSTFGHSMWTVNQICSYLVQQKSSGPEPGIIELELCPVLNGPKRESFDAALEGTKFQRWEDCSVW